MSPSSVRSGRLAHPASGCADTEVPGYRTWAFNSQDGQRQVVAMVNDDALSRRAEAAVARMVRTGLCL